MEIGSTGGLYVTQENNLGSLMEAGRFTSREHVDRIVEFWRKVFPGCRVQLWYTEVKWTPEAVE